MRYVDPHNRVRGNECYKKNGVGYVETSNRYCGGPVQRQRGGEGSPIDGRRPLRVLHRPQDLHSMGGGWISGWNQARKAVKIARCMTHQN